MYTKIESNLPIPVMQYFSVLQYAICCLLTRTSAAVLFKCFHFRIYMWRVEDKNRMHWFSGGSAFIYQVAVNILNKKCWTKTWAAI